MIRVCDLPHGWTLYADTECHDIRVKPVFMKGPRRLSTREMAMQPEAFPVFREVKRLLDIKDYSFVRSDSLEWSALDMAKFSLQLALQDVEKWDRSLLETGIGAS